MKVFSNEADLKTRLDRFDELVRACAFGKISFAKFDELYDTFYCAYALDGHESDAAEQELLARYEARIALHRDVCEEVLTRVCSDEDATSQRTSRQEGSARLRPSLSSSKSWEDQVTHRTKNDGLGESAGRADVPELAQRNLIRSSSAVAPTR